MSTYFKHGLSSDGESIHIHRFRGQFLLPAYVSDEWFKANQPFIRKGLALDVETTGLDPLGDVVIEFGSRSFFFHSETGDIVKLGARYEALQDPGRPLPREITELTGLTDEKLRGQKIDWTQIETLVESADLVLAHNASFDRPFLEKTCKSAAGKVWGCSFKQIDWIEKGFPSPKLELLELFHGFFVEAHRAGEDADGMVHLLSMQDTETGASYLKEILNSAFEPQVIIRAFGSPFAKKDHLKHRGYRWNDKQRVWQKSVNQNHQPGELLWLQEEIYTGQSLQEVEQKLQLQTLTLYETFRSESC